MGHHLINDLKELCLFYIKREDISVMAPPSKFLDENTEYDQDSRNNKNFNSNLSFQSKKSSNLNQPRAGSQRNRSFSSFLSQ